jgi:hypothetical protein
MNPATTTSIQAKAEKANVNREPCEGKSYTHGSKREGRRVIPPLDSTNIISKILSPAVRFWLRSQVDSVEELQIKISGQDHQILGGYVPSVLLNSRRAVYQGLHLGEVLLKGENIRVNIGQVIKGKPFRLLEPIKVSTEVRLKEADLQASLASPVLPNACTDLLLMILELQEIANPSEILEKHQVSWQQITLNLNHFCLRGTLTDRQNRTTPLLIAADLALANPQTLRINPVQLQVLPDLKVNLKEFEVDLGNEVEIEQLCLEPGNLSCFGRLIVRS